MKFSSWTVGVLSLASVARADIAVFDDPELWFAVTGDVTTLSFTEYPLGTFIDDEYEDQGILFTDGADMIQTSSAFVNDGWGLQGWGDIDVAFPEPRTSLAVDYPGLLRARVFDGDELLETIWLPFSGGLGTFAGIVSSVPFDRVELYDPVDELAFIDDLHFGPTIPAPAGWAVAAAVLIAGGARPRQHAPLHGTLPWSCCTGGSLAAGSCERPDGPASTRRSTASCRGAACDREGVRASTRIRSGTPASRRIMISRRPADSAQDRRRGGVLVRGPSFRAAVAGSHDPRRRTKRGPFHRESPP